MLHIDTHGQLPLHTKTRAVSTAARDEIGVLRVLSVFRTMS